MLVDVAYYL